jgi:hypothetical protein
MPNWKKVIVSGSNAVLNSITASFTGSLTGTLIGTASWAAAATTALTTVVTDTTTGTGPYYVTFVDATSGGVAQRVDSTGLTYNATTNTIAATASQALTASFATSASQAVSSSYALTASFALNGGGAFPFTGSALITGSLGVTGSLTVSGSDGGIETVGGYLKDSNGIASIMWGTGNRILRDSVAGDSINWESRVLINSGGGTTADWQNTTLYDGSNVSSLAWNDRILYTPGGNSFAWNNEYYTASTLYQLNAVALTTQNDFIDNLPTPYVGQIIEATVHGTVTNGYLVFLDTDGIWYNSKNTITRGVAMLGICVDQSKGLVLLEGDVIVSNDNTLGTYVISASMGSPVYIGQNDGELTTTLTNGVVRTVGHIYYQSTTTANYWLMKFRPSNDWYEQI